MDEVPQVFQHYSYEVPDTKHSRGHEASTDLITLEPYKGNYSRVKIKKRKRAALTRIAKDDVVDETIRQIAQTLLNKHYDSFVNTNAFQKLKDGDKTKLSFFSIMMPTVLDGFSSVTLASANFQDSFAYQLWNRLGVDFSEDKKMASLLRFQKHTNGHLITIKYAIENNWSKKLRDSKIKPDTDDETTYLDAYVAGIKAEFPDVFFAYQANKDVSQNVFGENGHRLPNVPHGLNTFSHINNIAFLSSLNPHPEVFAFLKTFGINKEAVRRAIYYQGGYQSVLRTSIRDPNNKEQKTDIVPDRGLAEYLHERFPNSKLEKLNTAIPDEIETNKPGRPRKHQSSNDRKADYRQRQKQKILNDLLALQSVPYDSIPLEVEQTQPRIGDEKAIRRRLYSHFVPDPLTISIYRDKYANVPAGYVHWENVELFISDLKSWWLRALKNKESNFLVSPAIFDPNHTNREGNQKRGRSNIQYLRHIWLDFENGELQPNELAKLFPHTRLVIFNTYNHTNEKPRFRVVFPTTQSITPEAYEILWDNRASKIEDAGFWVFKKKPNLRPSGLDVSKRSPTSLFYAPCQAKSPGDSFFIDYNESNRQLLEPMVWIENNIIPFPMPFIAEDQPFNGQRKVNQEQVEKATEEWRGADHREGDNDRFWRYALALRADGLSLPEIERTLHHEVQSADKPIKRRAQIPTIITSLRNSLRRAG